MGCLRNDKDLEDCCMGMYGTWSAQKLSVGVAFVHSTVGKLGIDDQTDKQRGDFVG